jgi:hypothetical protein
MVVLAIMRLAKNRMKMAGRRSRGSDNDADA